MTWPDQDKKKVKKGFTLYPALEGGEFCEGLKVGKIRELKIKEARPTTNTSRIKAEFKMDPSKEEKARKMIKSGIKIGLVNSMRFFHP